MRRVKYVREPSIPDAASNLNPHQQDAAHIIVEKNRRDCQSRTPSGEQQAGISPLELPEALKGNGSCV
jgi:hypothetical protein